MSLYIVADGVGGAQRGEVASILACQLMREQILNYSEALQEYSETPTQDGRNMVRAMLRRSVLRVCREIYDHGQSLEPGSSMGTTLDLVLIVANTAFLAHIGDGRIYLLRQGEAHQLTEDHTLVAQQLRSGSLTPEEARRSRNRNMVTRALGIHPSTMMDLLEVDLQPRDGLMLCTDGIHDVLHNEELVPLIHSWSSPDVPLQLCRLATQRGSKDNLTALWVEISRPSEHRPVVPPFHIEVLKRCRLFQNCTYRELLQLASRCTLITLGEGEVLFEQGERGDACFVVAEGTLELTQQYQSLAMAQPGDFFGELSLIEQPQRSATARALVPSRLLRLSRGHFMQLLREEDYLSKKLLWSLLVRLSGLIRSANDRLMEEGWSALGFPEHSTP